MPVQTIKGSRQKITDGNPSNYGQYIPFGADGEYVDMLSGLNLERELKLGGDHLASIIQGPNGSTIITQKYATDEATGTYYKVITTISEDGSVTTITSQLYWVNSLGAETLKNTKTITIDQSGNQTEIQEVLS